MSHHLVLVHYVKLLVTISSLVQVSSFHIHRCSQWKCLSCSIIWMELPQSQSRSFKVDGSFQLKVERSGEKSLLPPLMKHDSHLDTFKTNEAEKNSFRGKWTFGEKWNLRGEHWGNNEHLRNQDLGKNENSEADLNLKFFFLNKAKGGWIFSITNVVLCDEQALSRFYSAEIAIGILFLHQVTFQKLC